MRGAAALGLVFMASSACRSDDLQKVSGDGTLKTLSITDDRGVNAAIATRDDSLLALSTTGPHGILLVTDNKLSPVGEMPRPPTRLAASYEAGAAVLCFSGRRFTILSLPQLRPVEVLEADADVLGRGEPRLCARQGGWVSVNTAGEIVQIETGPLRLGRSGRATIR